MTDATKAAQMPERVYCKIHKHPGSDDVNIIAAYEYPRHGLTEYTRTDLTTPAANTGDVDIDELINEISKAAICVGRCRVEMKYREDVKGDLQLDLVNSEQELDDAVEDAKAHIKPALQRPEPSECQTCHGKGGWEESACGEGCCRSGVKCEDCNGTGSITLAPRQVDVLKIKQETLEEYSNQLHLNTGKQAIYWLIDYLAQRGLIGNAPKIAGGGE